MNVSKLFKMMMAILFISSLAFPFTATADAASTSSATVTASNLNVREKASDKAKKVGSLKKGTKVTVYSKTKSGWSEIRYNKKKAYVSTEFLKFKKKVASYKMDTSKVYVYKSNGKKYTYSSTGAKYNKVWTIWNVKGAGESWTDIEKETSEGYYIGWPESEYFIALGYPLKVGAKWESWDGSNTYIAKVTSMSKTVKTPAGTFNKVVEVKESDGSTRYYAKNVGLIKAFVNGEKTSELVELKKKK
ncbi:SH3 domain-containing protein [Peribacillus sp. NPDC097225]|uniref:SH3 domain-containing protein n=1 Tax=Peribacillus sp. NPDC097225 TaxID=3364400 RepID=UPI0038097512